MAHHTYLFGWVLFLIVFNNVKVLSSPSLELDSHSAPTQQSIVSTILSIQGGSNTTTSPRKPKQSSVTFLYELHEHEIYNPQTSSWTSRRFTQSPITGGGGRDSTSLDPASCSPPRNYAWDGEWKIDMAGEMRDGFGWEYYVGRFDGLGRRRRRWVRNLRRIGEQVPRDRMEKLKNVTKATVNVEEKKMSPTLLRTIIDQYNFKGFGWSFSKSLLWKRSVGATFRIPLSSNFEFFDRYAAIPFASWTTYFGYPWVVAAFLNASLPLEVLEWTIAGVLWKIKWAFAVVSAILRTLIDAVIWIVTTPLRTWLTFRQIMSNVARKHVSGSGMAQSLIDSIDSETDGKDDDKPNIEGLIELSTASASKDVADNMSTATVVSSTRGGASSFRIPIPKRQFKTMLGHKVPTFHRGTNIEYSSIISQRIGVCISYRVSKERGYEYRWNFFCSFLPTQECWEHIDKICTQKLEALKRIASKGRKSAVDGYESTPKPSAIKSFLYSHSATLGLSGGYPLPVDPHFSLNLLLSTSGFYYGWLLKSIASILCLHKPTAAATAVEIEPSSEKNDRETSQLANSALDERDGDTEIETSDDEGS
jgi:hypothetical protein